MKRTAILIGSTSGDLAGVDQDLNQWRSFLSSPYGGAWLDKKEIKILRNPDKGLLLDLLQLVSSDDYVMLAFSGHGEVRKDRLGFPETFLHINEKELISESELNPRTERCLMLLDCCRQIAEKSADKYIIKESSEVNPAVFRELYDNELTKSEKGCVKIYAADLSEAARDENSFSIVMIRQAMNWIKEDGHPVLDLAKTMLLTQEYFAQKYPQQTPRYQGGRRMRHFPFVVNPVI